MDEQQARDIIAQSGLKFSTVSFRRKELHGLLAALNLHILQLPSRRAFGVTRAKILSLGKRACHQLELQLGQDGMGDQIYRRDIAQREVAKLGVVTELKSVVSKLRASAPIVEPPGSPSSEEEVSRPCSVGSCSCAGR